MTPLFFGHGTRRLFGVYAPPPSRAAASRAFVLCAPWGQEYLRAHRSLRQLASMLCASGCHVLRFDYFGTGDSSGDLTQADVRGWTDDIEVALEELRDMTGTARVGLIGLRLGAALAATTAVRLPRVVDTLVMWDPVVSGRAYLQELLATEIWMPQGMAKPRARASSVGGGHEVHGFAMTAAMAAELEALDIAPLAPKLPPKTLVVASGPDPSLETLRSALAERTRPAAIEDFPALPAWREDGDTGAGAVPVNLIQRVVQWATR
jgi:exosortase A-associated hydrolase 2